MPRDVGVVVVAAGRSLRMGAQASKVWEELGGRPLLAWSVAAAAGLEEVAALVLVVRAEEVERARAIVPAALARRVRLEVVPGGAQRSDSVRAGLAALAQAGDVEVVLVQDAARPLASVTLYRRVAEAARRHGAAVPVVPVVDTLRRGTPEGTRVVPREDLHLVQTPQGFRRRLLEEAHRQGREREVTDDAALVEALGRRVELVEGEVQNRKITVPADLELARAWIGRERPWAGRRVGLGSDLHRLEPGGPLRLGGVDLPADRHAVGHSDGDALLHAVADAILGALALGDLGEHFSDRDPAVRGMDSAFLLERVVELAAGKGFRPAQVDLVVELERPRLAPHREAIRQRLAALLGLSLDAVSVKAKTAEGTGAIGRGEALACQALVVMEGGAPPLSSAP